MQHLPRFQERFSSHLPAAILLSNLGWEYLSPQDTMAQRGGKLSEVVLVEVLRAALAKRQFMFAGKSYPLSQNAIDSIVAEVCNIDLSQGLLHANEKLYNHLLYGISVTEFVEGKKVNPTVFLIDWQQVANNHFCFSDEFQVTRTNGVAHRRPDFVCFVNGLPLVVIEAKRPDGKALPSIEEGISQHLRNQRADEIPQLFMFSQLLLSISGTEGKYATCGTPTKFWAIWREEDMTEADFLTKKNQKLTALFAQKMMKEEELTWYENWSQSPLSVTEQDRLLIALLSQDRLLEFVRYFILFDKKNGKIAARYQQVFGIKRLIERLNQRRQDGGREGGVIWHTTGSGKSFTMVFLSKALILHDSLKQCRIVVVTDRIDLEKQLSRTFASSGELGNKKDQENALATSGKRLAEQIGSGNERVIFSLIQKFNTATKLKECFNDSADIVVLIDEGHRSQGGENHIRMKQALPNASFVAFTGTPLLKEDKTTNKFGPILHAYTMQQAVEDGAVTPLLYEERISDLEVNERAIDSWFERITTGLSEQQKADLKRKYARKGPVYHAEDRIRLIAFDIANHFVNHVESGLKAQLACDSKSSAIKYKQYLDEIGLFESALVISAPDSREGNTEIDESASDDVVKWWKENVGSQDESTYTTTQITRFDNDDKLKMLIVVDKLLTGFDEPKNTVLYIDKPLKAHNLIQAIARVNRLHTQKKYGLLIDYRGILKELDTTIEQYQDLAERTQGGYDISDLAGLYQQMSTEYKRLPMLYRNLWAVFATVKNKQDIEQLRQVLMPKMEWGHGQLVDINAKVRDDFYEALSAFSSCLKVALQSASFFEDSQFSDQDRAHYKATLQQFSALRLIAQQDAGEKVDYREYETQVKNLLDKHVVGVQVKEPEGSYDVSKLGKQQKPETWSAEKTRNETDMIKTRVIKMIEQEMGDDPYAKEAFSQLLKKIIAETTALFEHPLKQYWLFKEFEEKVQTRKLDELPDFQGNQHAQAFFGVFKLSLPNFFAQISVEQQQSWVDFAFEVDRIIDQVVKMYSINPQAIETEIRKQLLPLVFQRCKAVGAGMDQTKRILEMLVQIVRGGIV